MKTDLDNLQRINVQIGCKLAMLSHLYSLSRPAASADHGA